MYVASVMGWWYSKRSAERVKRATERQRTPHPSPKPDLKSCALRVTASSTPRHAASLDMYHARMSLLPLACDGGWEGLTCWRSPISIGVSILERACAAIFSRRKKKEPVTIFADSITHNKRRTVYFVCRKGPNSPSGAVARVRCDWLISRMCATPLNSIFLKSYDVTNKCGFQSEPSLYLFLLSGKSRSPTRICSFSFFA